MKKTFYLLLILGNIIHSQTQFTIKGNFPQASNKDIFIKGFTMSGDTLLAKTTADFSGNFIISYPSSYRGAALVEIKDIKSIATHPHAESQCRIGYCTFKTREF